MSEAELLRRIIDLEKRLGRTEVQERPIAATGIWTPTLVGSSTPGTFTYGGSTGGAYTRIGNRVLFNGRIQISAIAVAPAGNLSISGLPLVAGSVTGNISGGGEIAGLTGITLTAGYSWLSLRILAGNTTIDIMQNGSAVANARIQGSAVALIGGSFELQFEEQYQL